MSRSAFHNEKSWCPDSLGCADADPGQIQFTPAIAPCCIDAGSDKIDTGARQDRRPAQAARTSFVGLGIAIASDYFLSPASRINNRCRARIRAIPFSREPRTYKRDIRAR